MSNGSVLAEQPLVSCVTCFLNAEAFIEEAIRSVLAQTYTHWELLLVDDGSSDGSTQIALKYASTYPANIFYLEHDMHRNLGAGHSRNVGIQHAKGTYIAFLDADDMWLPEKLAKQVALLEAQPATGMVFGLHNRWFGWTGRPEDSARDQQFPALWDSDIQLDTVVQPPTLFIQYLQDRLGTPLTCGALMRREVIDAVGGFDESVSYLNEDGPFFAKIYLKTPVFLESGCWDRYRQHQASTVHTARAKRKWFDDRKAQPVHLAEMQILKQFVIDQGVTDPAIWEGLRSQLLPYRHPYIYMVQQSAKRIRHGARTSAWKITWIAQYAYRRIMGTAARQS